MVINFSDIIQLCAMLIAVAGLIIDILSFRKK